MQDKIWNGSPSFLGKVAGKDKLLKRDASGMVSDVYDLLGVGSPEMVQLKLALKDLWKDF